MSMRTTAPEESGQRPRLKAFVIYESHWGNTAAVARAIAEGLGPEARACTTEEIGPGAAAQGDLIVAGAPVIGFRLATDAARTALARGTDARVPPVLAQPSLRDWLESLPRGTAWSAAFETRLWWSARGATGDIEQRFRKAGYRSIVKAAKFVVAGTYGPLREGELERARAWGESLRAAVADSGRDAEIRVA